MKGQCKRMASPQKSAISKIGSTSNHRYSNWCRSSIPPQILRRNSWYYIRTCCKKIIRKDIRKNLDEGKVECSIFVDLQKAFDTVDHNILLVKLEHFGICGVANDCFKSYFFDRRQFVYTNGFNSNHAMPKPIRFLNSY